MSSSTKWVFRLLMAWNDAREEAWLTEQARQGWHVEKVGPLGYTMAEGAPAEVVYRLDVAPASREERDEYLTLCRDAGWEHVGRRGLWNIFRRPASSRGAMEIHTDPRTRIAAYQRVLGLTLAMAVAMLVQALATIARDPATPVQSMFPWLQFALAAVFGYASLRMVLAVNRLKKGLART
jgi:hypothetical protein